MVPGRLCGHAAGSGGCAGIVIPPAVTFIVYGTTTGVSVGQLLLSGVVPGVLGGLVLCVLCWYFAKKRHYPKGEHFSAKEVVLSTKSALAALVMPLIIMGGIYSGIFTPTESAAVATAYGLIATKLFYREMDWQLFKKVVRGDHPDHCQHHGPGDERRLL